MKKLINYLTVTALVVLSSCVAAEPEPSVAGSVELTGILESDPDTRTYIQGATGGVYYPYWSGDEILAVYAGGSDVPARFSLKTGKDTPTATFSGAVGGSNFIAFYPFEAAADLKGNTMSFILPSEQEYASGSFGNGFFPMLAVSNSTTLKFKNLCSVLKVSLTGDTQVASISFTANNPQTFVSGPATVLTDRPDNPVLTMCEGGSPSVKLICNGVKLKEDVPVTFMLVIPPGEYKGGFSLKIKTPEGTITHSTDKDVIFQRSQLRSIPAFECVGGEVDLEDLPENMICYVTESGKKVNSYFSDAAFGHKVLSHTYEGGHGTLLLDGILTDIGNDVFSDTDLTEIYLPPSVESIGKRAFLSTRLKSFRVPDKLHSVGYLAFGLCASLSRFYGPHTSEDGTAIVFDNEIVAYIGATGETISIPEGVISIAAGSIRLTDQAKQRLREVILPEGFEIIDDADSFSDQPMLEYITLPSTFKMAWQGTFANCPKLKKFLGSLSDIKDNGTILIEPNGYVSGYAGAGITDYVLPEGVTYIYDRTFSGKPDLRSLTFPESFEGVLHWPFYPAENLTRFYGKYVADDHVSLVKDGTLIGVAPGIEHYKTPEGVTEIASQLFAGKFKSIILGDSVTSVGSESFSYLDDLETIVFSASLKTVGGGNFKSASNIKNIYFRSSVPPSLDESSPVSIGDDLVVYVPEESLAAYKRSDWSFFAPYMQGYNPEDLPEYYSIDGNVTVMQQASEGKGIDLVLMGDAFTQEEIENGTYRNVMFDIAEAFFSIEPYKSFRNLFNVYRVDVVSQTSGYDKPGQALGTTFGEGTHVEGNDNKCLQYARIAVPEDRMDNVLIMVAMNSKKYAGTCYMYGNQGFTGDWSEGFAIAYFPLGENGEMIGQLVHHEAGGHGFAKLEDEYYYDGTIPASTVTSITRASAQGWYRNVDFTSDPSEVKWSNFLSDARYASEGLGVFEGGATYSHGVYRPSQTSIMNDNTGIYNAPSRYAIWYRIQKLAYGPDCYADYEQFTSWDAKNRSKAASHAPGIKDDRPLPALARPVVREKSWREVLGE